MNRLHKDIEEQQTVERELSGQGEEGHIQKGLWAILKREAIRMLSRPIYFVSVLIIPLATIVFFATYLSDGLPIQLPIAVVDLDNTGTSRQVIRQAEATPRSKIVMHLNSFHDADKAMREGKIYAFFLIPKDFQADLLAGRQPEVPFYTENCHFISGSLLMQDLMTVLNTVSAGVNMKTRIAKGENASSIMGSIQPIATDIHIIGNPTMNYAFYLATILLPGVICILVLVVTVYSFGSEMKQRSSREVIRMAQGNMWNVILGKSLPYTLVFTILMIFSDIVMWKYMHMPYGENIGLVILASLLCVFANQAIGICIVGLVPILRDALSISACYGTLGLTFSGLTYPALAMLPAVRPYTLIYPIHHYYTVYTTVQLNGLGFSDCFGAFIGFLILSLLPLLTIRNLKKAYIEQNYSLG